LKVLVMSMHFINRYEMKQKKNFTTKISCKCFNVYSCVFLYLLLKPVVRRWGWGLGRWRLLGLSYGSIKPSQSLHYSFWTLYGVFCSLHLLYIFFFHSMLWSWCVLNNFYNHLQSIGKWVCLFWQQYSTENIKVLSM
jgi:hypothetical protein